MRKYFIVFSLLIILFCCHGPLSSQTHINQINLSTVDPDEQLDQAQIYSEPGLFLPVGFSKDSQKNISIGQSFTPQKKILTCIELYLQRNQTTTYPFVVTLRDNLTGSDILRVSIPSTEILVDDFSWILCDFENTIVSPGVLYYIVVYTKNDTNNWYGLGGNNSDLYPNGSVYISDTEGVTWQQNIQQDICFKTYGYDPVSLNVTFTAKIGVSVCIQNNNPKDITNVSWTIQVSGLILAGGIKSGVSDIPKNQAITTGILPLGIGPVTIFVSVNAPSMIPFEQKYEGFLLFFIILLQNDQIQR